MKLVSGAAIAVAAAQLFLTATPIAAAAEQTKVQCMGANACKGKSECATASNGCMGQNACKGQGRVSMSEKECVDKGGKPEKR